jgi:hypothetical protein
LNTAKSNSASPSVNSFVSFRFIALMKSSSSLWNL